MSMVARVRQWLRANLLRRRLEREMREEMASHLDRATARLMERGLAEEDARRQATREFGNVPYLQEEGRYARGTMWLDALAADTRFALRHFARRPLTTIVMFVVLAFGMSISTLLFSFVHSYAVQPPLGIAPQDDLVRIRGSVAAGEAGRGTRPFSEREFHEYRQLTEHFEAVTGWAFASVVLDTGDDIERRGLDARATFVTQDYFSVLGVRPVVGAGLPAGDVDDPSLAAVAVIGHDLWVRLFDSSPDVIGSTLSVNGVQVTVVGVAAERFNGVAGYTPLQLWLPLSARRLVAPGLNQGFRAAGRLRPGVTREAATAAIQVVAARMAAEEFRTRGADDGNVARPEDVSTDVVPLLSANGDPMFDRDVRLMTLLIGLLGLLVLLVTCTNVSALLTGLASARRQEIAVRLSLGAARSRVIRQLLTESALLAVLAALAALFIVWQVQRAVAMYLPVLPMKLGITLPTTTFTFGVALAVGVLFGLSPALHATRLAIASAMRDSMGTLAASRARLQRGLVVAQVAFTQPLIVLLAAVLLLVVANNRPQARTEYGDRLVTLTLRDAVTGSTAEATSRADLRAARQRLLDRLHATPGIGAAVPDAGGATSLGRYTVDPQDRVAGAVHDGVRLSGAHAPEGFLSVRGIRLLRGRDFTQADVGPTDAGSGDVAVILGAGLARLLWPGADPLGRRLRAVSDTAVRAGSLVVVGVVEDPRATGRRGEEHTVWLPADTANVMRTVLIRTAGSAAPLVPVIRKIVQEEPSLAANPQTIAEREEGNARRYRIVMSGVMVAGAMALLLSAIGLYAVVAFAVGQRTREIAVRIAVGAGTHQIVRKFVGDGLRLSAWGIALGLPASVLGLRALLVAAGDDFTHIPLPSVTAIAATGVIVVATAAVWIPARRAASVDPAVTLRRE